MKRSSTQSRRSATSTGVWNGWWKTGDFIDFVHVADRICGLCSFMHSLGYCQAVEEIMGIEVPERALYLRTIWAELSRVHSHIFWLGVAADAFGFESLFMQALRLREPVLNIFRGNHGSQGYPGGVQNRRGAQGHP